MPQGEVKALHEAAAAAADGASMGSPLPVSSRALAHAGPAAPAAAAAAAAAAEASSPEQVLLRDGAHTSSSSVVGMMTALQVHGTHGVCAAGHALSRLLACGPWPAAVLRALWQQPL